MVSKKTNLKIIPAVLKEEILCHYKYHLEASEILDVVEISIVHVYNLDVVVVFLYLV